MSGHDASAQMLGYLFQLHCGLFLLLSDNNERVSVCLEKYDDVTIVDEKGGQSNYQIKLHTKSVGDLTNCSTDLWRTLKAWMDWYTANPDKLLDTNFTLITNANAPESSAASKLRLEGRDVALSYTTLKSAAEISTNESHKKYYDAFLSMTQEKAEQFLQRIFVLDNNGNIQTIDDEIKNKLKYSVDPRYLTNLFERLIGWWLKKAEDALISDTPVFISQREIRAKIIQVASEYREDNLPIDEFDEADIPKPGKSTEKIFQLQLLQIHNHKLKLATKNYHRAFIQRSKWVNEELAYITELDNYDSKLTEEWEHYFIQMEDELSRIDTVTEINKRLLGIKLLEKVEDLDIRIREKVSEPFVMRGSYHMLADDLRVGWHIDYKPLVESYIDAGEI